MWRLAAIAVAGVAGAAVFFTALAEMRRQAETELAAAGQAVVEQSSMRLCVGPARVTLGGHPFARLAFGGEGCSRHVAHLVGFRIVRTPATADVVLGFARAL
jgi:hypothetical protein